MLLVFFGLTNRNLRFGPRSFDCPSIRRHAGSLSFSLIWKAA